MKFLKEYWLWIAVPMVIILGALVALLYVSGSDDSVSPFEYNVF